MTPRRMYNAVTGLCFIGMWLSLTGVNGFGQDQFMFWICLGGVVPKLVELMFRADRDSIP